MAKRSRANLMAGLVIAAGAAAAAWYAFARLAPPQGAMATVWVDGRAVMTLTLPEHEGEYLSLEEDYGKPVHFKVEEGKIRFIDVDCPDHICENTGFIYLEGQTAVCMPNRVSLTITGPAGG